MWGFATHPPRMVEAAPKHDEFFLASVPEQAHALVREVTQNSADAIVGGASQVQLRFRFVDVERTTFERYLQSLPSRPTLAAHCEAAGMRELPLNDDPVRCLVIEDFGTKGLTGRFDAYEESSSFQAFWKRYGTSNKGSEQGGRHGIGKSVVPSSSALHAFFGLTRRWDDQAELFMGQIVLRPHRIGDTTYDSFGQFSPSEETQWALPYEEATFIASVKADFGLERTNEAGLSLIVPYVVPSVTQETLVRAAVEHCFHQILADHLHITVGEQVLSRDTLLDFVERHQDASLKSAARLSAEAATAELPTFTPAKAPVTWRLGADWFDEATIDVMRKRFEAGETVKVSVPLEIRPRNKTPEEGRITLYLKRANDSDAAAETYVRGRVTVPQQQRQLGGSALVGLLVAEDGPASTFLGDSEDVAHTKWVKNKLAASYVAPGAAFDVVKTGLKELKKILVGEGDDQHVKDYLKDFFWQPKPAASGGSIGGVGLRGVDTNEPVFAITETTGGFIAEIKDLPSDEAVDASIEVVYAVRRGSGRWSKEDFVIGKEVTVTQTGNGVVEFDGNKIIVTGARAGLRLKAMGFDINRDLLIRVRELGTAEVR